MVICNYYKTIVPWKNLAIHELEWVSINLNLDSTQATYGSSWLQITLPLYSQTFSIQNIPMNPQNIAKQIYI